MTADARLAQDLATVSRVYRLTIQARARGYSRHGYMDPTLEHAAEVAGDLAREYAVAALALQLPEVEA